MIMSDSFQSSFARSMSNQGFDTWTLEVRGTGLSALVGDHGEGKQPLNAIEAELNFTRIVFNI
jgi:predicted alpha/beta hydrolase